MLKLWVRNPFARCNGVTRRFGTSRTVRSPGQTPSAGPTVPPTATPKPKKHRFRRFVIGSTLLLGSAYAGGVYLSLDNDDVFDVFTHYAPFGHGAVAVVDDWRFRTTVYDHNAPVDPLTVRNKVVPVDTHDSKVKVREYTTPTEPRRAEPQLKSKQPDIEPASPVKPSAHSTSNAAKASPESDTAPGSLPVLALQGLDPALEEAVEGLNKWITALNRSQRPTEKNVSDLSAVLERASVALSQSRDAHTESALQDLDKHKTEVDRAAAASIAAAKDAFDVDRRRLLEACNERLDRAVAATKQAVIAEANNLLQSQFVEQYEEFTREIQNRVEAEREGRLGRIDELTRDVTDVQRALATTGSVLADQDGVVNYFTALANLEHILTSGADAVPVQPLLDALAKALPSDPLVKAAIAAVPADVRSYGVLSPAQLAARFQLLEPEIRRASLAPADAGVAGHLGSLVASQLLVKKTGMPSGDDVESLLARTQTLLAQGRVVDAVAEVNTLQGWSKKIAADWLAEGRKRAELEFLVDALAAEGRLHALSKA